MVELNRRELDELELALRDGSIGSNGSEDVVELIDVSSVHCCRASSSFR